MSEEENYRDSAYQIAEFFIITLHQKGWNLLISDEKLRENRLVYIKNNKQLFLMDTKCLKIGAKDCYIIIKDYNRSLNIEIRDFQDINDLINNFKEELDKILEINHYKSDARKFKELIK